MLRVFCHFPCEQEITTRLLQDHRDGTLALAGFIDKRFKDLEHKLAHVPKSIEEVVELEEFIAGAAKSVDGQASSG